MLDEYKLEEKAETIEEIERDIVLENELYQLVTLIIESSFYYDTDNKLVITKSQSQIIKEINENLDKYCKVKGVDKKTALEIAKEAIRNNNELKFNPTERKMAINLLGIKDDNGER